MDYSHVPGPQPQPAAMPTQARLAHFYAYVIRETASLLDDLRGIDGRRAYGERLGEKLVEWAVKTDRLYRGLPIPPALHLIPVGVASGAPLFGWSGSDVERILARVTEAEDGHHLARFLISTVQDCAACVPGDLTSLIAADAKDMAVVLSALAELTEVSPPEGPAESPYIPPTGR